MASALPDTPLAFVINNNRVILHQHSVLCMCLVVKDLLDVYINNKLIRTTEKKDTELTRYIRTYLTLAKRMYIIHLCRVFFHVCS